MTVIKTPRLGIQMMSTNMAAKEMVFNEAILAFDAMFSGTVIQVGAPGAGSDPGDTFIVPVGATGAWAGKDNQFAMNYNGWQFFTPTEHQRVYNVSMSRFFQYTVSGGWAEVAETAPTHLSDLSDCNTTVVTDGQLLRYDAASYQWVPWTLTVPHDHLANLLDVDLTGLADLQLLRYDAASHKFLPFTLPAVPTLLTLPDVTSGEPTDGWIAIWNHTTHKLQFVDPASLVVLDSLSRVGDVHYGTGPAVNDVLVWNGALWAPSSATIHYLFENMTDGPGTMVGAAGKILIVNPDETALEYIALADFLSLVGFTFLELTDTPDAYTGAGHKLVAVKGDASGLEFIDAPSTLAVVDESTTIDTAVTSLRFIGAAVSAVEGSPGHVNVTVSETPAVTYQDHDTDVTQPTKINYAGHVIVTEAAGVMTVSITGVDHFNALSDVTITDVAEGDIVSYDAGSAKWVNVSLSARLGTLPLLSPATYEHGPFAPPAASAFVFPRDATAMSITDHPGRGCMFVPGTYTGGFHFATNTRTLINNLAPWTVTARIAVNGEATPNYYGGVVIARSASDAIAFCGISSDGHVLFRYWDGSTLVTVNNPVAEGLNWVRIGYDGTNLRAAVSADGMLWSTIGSVNSATALGGVPNRVGIGHNISSDTASNCSTLVTYYDDADLPAGARTSQGVASLGLGDLTNVDATAPTDGQALIWSTSSGKWVPGAGGGGGGISLPTGGTTGQVLEKNSSTDGDASWHDAPVAVPPGGTTGQALVKASATDGDVTWSTISGGGGGGGGGEGVGTVLSANRNITVRAPTAAQFADTSFYGRGASSVPLTLTDDPVHGLRLHDGSGDGYALRSQMRAIPGSPTAFEVVARMDMPWVSHESGYGLVMQDASGNAVMFQIYWNGSGWNWASAKMNGTGGTFTASFVGGLNGLDYQWLKLAFDASGNLFFGLSHDGELWTNMNPGHTLSEFSSGAPVKYGFICQIWNSSFADILIPYFWSTEFPAPARADIPGSIVSGVNGSSVVGAHKYWRMRNIVSTIGVLSVASMVDAEFRATPGGAAQTVAAAIASSDWGSSWLPSYAVDGNPSTMWVANGYDANPWFEAQFAAPVLVEEIAITARSDSYFTQAPTSFELLCSDDGLKYRNLGTFVAPVAYTSGLQQLFAIPAVLAGGGVPTGGTTGQVLTKDSATDGDATWHTPTTGVTSLAALTDVVIGTPATGNVLTFDGTDWRPAAPTGGGGGGTPTSKNRNITFNPPLASQFTDASMYGRSSGSNALVTTDDPATGLVLWDGDADSPGYKSLTRAIPGGAGTPFDFAARLTMIPGGTAPAVGLVMQNAAGHQLAFVKCWDNTNKRWELYINQINSVGGSLSESARGSIVGSTNWLRFKVDASSAVHFYMSEDGTNWAQIQGGYLDDWNMNSSNMPTKYGFCLQSYGARYIPASISWFWSDEFPAPTSAPLA